MKNSLLKTEQKKKKTLISFCFYFLSPLHAIQILINGKCKKMHKRNISKYSIFHSNEQRKVKEIECGHLEINTWVLLNNKFECALDNLNTKNFLSAILHTKKNWIKKLYTKTKINYEK